MVWRRLGISRWCANDDDRNNARDSAVWSRRFPARFVVNSSCSVKNGLRGTDFAAQTAFDDVFDRARKFPDKDFQQKQNATRRRYRHTRAFPAGK
jgi:hypothetical protein